MSAPPVSFARHAGVCCLKLRGALRHDLAEPLDELSQRLFAVDQEPGSEDCRQLVIDLSEANFMDSTVIGLLVGLARDMRERLLPAPTLVCSHPEIIDLLAHMRLDSVFEIVPATAEGKDAEFTALTAVPQDAEHPLHRAQLILKAHEALMATNEDNRKEFSAVVEIFKLEVARLSEES